MKWSRKTSDGIAYHYNASNSVDEKAIPIVFIHGVGLRAESWEQQLAVFGDQYRCFAIDMPGHGDSELLDKPTLTLDDFAEALKNFINNVIGEPAIVVGHSLGAMTALQTAVTYPEVIRGVAALNAIFDRADSAAQKVQSRAESLLDNLEQNVSDQPIARWFDKDSKYQVQAQMCRDWLDNGNRLGYARDYRMFAYLSGISAAQLQTIIAPTLLLTGELDANSSPEMSLAMANIVPDARAVIVPKARHMTQMTHASEVNSALKLFFEQCTTHGNIDA